MILKYITSLEKYTFIHFTINDIYCGYSEQGSFMTFKAFKAFKASHFGHHFGHEAGFNHVLLQCSNFKTSYFEIYNRFTIYFNDKLVKYEP